jgi:hypothetical protein
MPDIKVRVGQQNAVKVVSTIAGSQSLGISGLIDVDVSGGLADGMVLVYNDSTNKWVATLDLTPGSTQNLDINGGNF